LGENPFVNVVGRINRSMIGHGSYTRYLSPVLLKVLR